MSDSQGEHKSGMIEYTTMTGEHLQLSKSIIKQYLVSGDANKVTDQEVMMFMSLCKFQKLNPFLREAYLIKYGNSAATIVTGKETFLKRAAKNQKYRGHKTGLENEGQVAWAEVYVEGYEHPIRCEVDYEEYVGKKRDGTITAMWKNKPRTMLKKVALVQALREAFPEDFGGMYSEEEVNEQPASEPLDITPDERTVEPQRKSSREKDITPKDDAPKEESSGETITESQCRLIRKKLKDRGVSAEEFKTHFNIEHVKDLQASKINEALKAIDEKTKTQGGN